MHTEKYVYFPVILFQNIVIKSLKDILDDNNGFYNPGFEIADVIENILFFLEKSVEAYSEEIFVEDE